MNKRLALVFAFAFVISAAASLLIYRLVSARLDVAARPSQTKLLVAARDLGLGTLIKEPDLKFADWTGPVPQHALVAKEDAIDRGVIAGIFADEPILETRLAPKGAGAGLAATIPVGMRAVAIRVNEVVGISGFAVPGMRVDVLILGNPGAGSGRDASTMSKILLQNMEVLSAGQQIQKDSEGKPVSVQVVNLLVTPEQAEILSLASNDARIQLVLRNPLDSKETKTPGSRLSELFGQPAGASKTAAPGVARRAPPPKPKPVAQAPKEPPPIIIEIYHGGKGGSRRQDSKFKGEEAALEKKVEEK